MNTITDKEGTPLIIAVDAERKAFTASLEDGTEIARSFFLDQGSESRIFYHIEVDSAFGGRGVAGALLNESLSATREAELTVVPICPVYVKYFARNKDAFISLGGSYRAATADDKKVAAPFIKEFLDE